MLGFFSLIYNCIIQVSGIHFANALAHNNPIGTKATQHCTCSSHHGLTNKNKKNDGSRTLITPLYCNVNNFDAGSTEKWSSTQWEHIRLIAMWKWPWIEVQNYNPPYWNTANFTSTIEQFAFHLHSRVHKFSRSRVSLMQVHECHLEAGNTAITTLQSIKPPINILVWVHHPALQHPRRMVDGHSA